MTTESFTFFWDGPFSQWHLRSFRVDGVLYNCAEQYMMAEKARLFGDREALANILQVTSPKQQKALGRTVRGFSEPLWNEGAKEVVYKGSRAKYGQNPELKELLLSTAGTTLVEASPYDSIWGIGLRASDSRAKSRETWRGTNWLGETLTRLRDEFIAEAAR